MWDATQEYELWRAGAAVKGDPVPRLGTNLGDSEIKLKRLQAVRHNVLHQTVRVNGGRNGDAHGSAGD